MVVLRFKPLVKVGEEDIYFWMDVRDIMIDEFELDHDH